MHIYIYICIDLSLSLYIYIHIHTHIWPKSAWNCPLDENNKGGSGVRSLRRLLLCQVDAPRQPLIHVVKHE